MLNGNQILRGGFGLVRGVTRHAERLGRQVVSTAFGTAQKARPARPQPKDLDDATLARKVESELFRDAHPLKGHIDVNAVDGTVYLRGQAERPDQITELEARVRAIPEVTAVENLLHLPKTPARSRTSGSRRPRPARSKKAAASADSPSRRSAKSPAKRSTAPRSPGKVSDDQTTRLVDKAEQTGRQASAAKRGREPAPLGSKDDGGESPPSRIETVTETGPAPTPPATSAPVTAPSSTPPTPGPERRSTGGTDGTGGS
jgi:hypothetical protein